jgi:hypothetical protein
MASQVDKLPAPNPLPQTLSWHIFFATMLGVLFVDTLRSAENVLREGHFGLFDKEASTVFFEVGFKRNAQKELPRQKLPDIA